MHALTYPETTTAEQLNNSVGGRLIMLFQQPNLSRSAKLDSAYKIIRESAPALPTREYILHSRILINAAEQSIINSEEIDAMTEQHHADQKMPLGANSEDTESTGSQFFTPPEPLHPLDELTMRTRKLLNTAQDLISQMKGGENN